MTYEPEGIRFYDGATGREMLLVADGSPSFAGWLCYRHPDGQWVTLRKATAEDRAAVSSLTNAAPELATCRAKDCDLKRISGSQYCIHHPAPIR